MNNIKASPGNEDAHYDGEYQPFEVAIGRGDGPAVCRFHIDKYLFRRPKKHHSKTEQQVREEDINKANWYAQQLLLIETLGARKYIDEVWNKKDQLSDKDHAKFEE